MVLRRWEVLNGSDEGLALEESAFVSLCGGRQFTLSTSLMKPNFSDRSFAEHVKQMIHHLLMSS